MKREDRKPTVDPIWRQSPDGRAVGVEEDIGTRAVGTLEPSRRDEPRLPELEPFIESCLALLPDPLGEGRTRLGFLLFILGAVARFWAHAELDDHRFPPYAEALLVRLGVPYEEAASLVAALPQLPTDPFAKRALRQGGDTLESWLASRDPNVPLQLTELIAEWRRP